MILAFEMTWVGTHHAITNGAMLQTLAEAFPGQELRVFAAPSHLDELRRDTRLMALPDIRLRPIKTDARHYGKTQIVSLRRLMREAAVIYRALREVDPNEECLMFLLSANSTAIFAAAWLARLFRNRRFGVHAVLHGNLYDITGWRTRNPLLRALDLRSAHAARLAPNFRFVLLEETIRDELELLLPGVSSRCDLLPHPVNPTEAVKPPPPLADPVKVGYVGLATKAKGIDIYLDVAVEMKRRFGDRIEFHHVGVVQAGADPARFAALAHPVMHTPLSRAEFTRRIADLHYIVLPFQPGYYNLSASGALIDAINWRRPVVVTRVPLVERIFDEAGPIGFLCDDAADMCDALSGVMDLYKPRYAEQVAALDALRAERLPETLGRRYREIVLTEFEGLLAIPAAPAKASEEVRKVAA